MAKNVTSENDPQPTATQESVIKTVEIKAAVEVFKILDPQGFTVILDSERWDHILKGHPEMAKLLTKIQETVANPEIIQRDAKHSETHYYYRLSGRSISRAKDLYVNAVVARNESDKTGQVKTAFLVATIRKHGEDFVWLNRK
jgi:putative heme iron utilization protein